MLSQTQMVAVRNAIESTYTGKCTITEHKKVTKANKSTGFEDVVTVTDQACKLSFSKISSLIQSDSSAKLVQTIKLFISPETQIAPGSKLTITQNGVTADYVRSGKPAIYGSHQEVFLELFERWA